MITPIPLLSSVRVASPCDASWEDMQAVEGDRVHFCMGCQKNVYNLSAMSRNEAEDLLRRHEGRLCVRYYQRRDGTVLTSDCPVGARAVGMSLIRRSTMAAGLFAMLFGAMAAVNHSQVEGDAKPLATPATGGLSQIPAPVPPPVVQGDVAPVPETPPVMGKMRLPEVRPTMGIVARQPLAPPKPKLSVMAGEVMLTPPEKEENNGVGPLQTGTATSEKDTTDEAILRSQRNR